MQPLGSLSYVRDSHGGSFKISREKCGFRWCRFDSSAALLVLRSSLIYRYWGDWCVIPAGGVPCVWPRALGAWEQKHRGRNLFCATGWLKPWLKAGLTLSVTVSVTWKAHWDMLMSEITGEDIVMFQPPGVYHSNVLCGLVREIKAQRKSLSVKMWLNN